MFCRHCGAEIEPTARVCPVCDNPINIHQPTDNQKMEYNTYPRPDRSSPYEKGYTERTTAPTAAPVNMDAIFSYPDASSAGSGMPYNQNMPPYQGLPPFYNAKSSAAYTMTKKNGNALVVEIILSLFGIFGVGWLMAGETTVGIILLVCSIFIYWPLVFLGTLLTFGLGLLCLGPLGISAIIINIVLLNNVLKKKAQRFTIHQPQETAMPPWR